MILNSPNHAHAKLVVHGLLKRIDTEYKDIQGARPSAPQPCVETVADLQTALQRCSSILKVRVVSPEAIEGIEDVYVDPADDGQSTNYVNIQVGFGPSPEAQGYSV